MKSKPWTSPGCKVHRNLAIQSHRHCPRPKRVRAAATAAQAQTQIIVDEGLGLKVDQKRGFVLSAVKQATTFVLRPTFDWAVHQPNIPLKEKVGELAAELEIETGW